MQKFQQFLHVAVRVDFEVQFFFSKIFNFENDEKKGKKIQQPKTYHPKNTGKNFEFFQKKKKKIGPKI